MSAGRWQGRLRRARTWTLLGVALAAAVAVSFVAGQDGDNRPLSPVNAGPHGAQAVAEVVRNQGVEVVQADSLTAAVSAVHDAPGATLLLHDPDGWLDPSRLSRLDGLAARLVLVEPGLVQLKALAPAIDPAGLVPETAGDRLGGDCAAPRGSRREGRPGSTWTAEPAAARRAAEAAGVISAGGLTYRGPLVCFPTPGAAHGAPAGSVAAAPTAPGREVLVLGNRAVLANGTVADHGNAALALHALGGASRLVWYQPSAADLSLADDGANPLALLPPWVNPLLLWLGIVLLLAAVWRGRRLGPLVMEPLPVVVPAAETADGRARLYQAAGSVNRAAANLRAATLARAARMLGLPAGTPVEAVVDAASRRTARSRQDVDALLRTHTPVSDRDLVRWSQALNQLEEEIKP